MTDENEENYDWVKASSDQLIAEINECIEDVKRSRAAIIDQNCYAAGQLDGEIDGLKKAIAIIEENVESEIDYAKCGD